MGSNAKVCALCHSNLTGNKNSGNFAILGKKLSKLFPLNWDKDEGAVLDKLRVLACAKCVTFVTLALESREKIGGKEEKVRKVQVLILKMQRKVGKLLRELEGMVGEFKKAVGGLEGILEESRDWSEVMEEDEDLMNEATEFRSSILSVFEDLKVYKTNLNISPRPAQTQSNLEWPVITSSSSIKIDPEPVPLSKRPKRSCANDQILVKLEQDLINSLEEEEENRMMMEDDFNDAFSPAAVEDDYSNDQDFVFESEDNVEAPASPVMKGENRKRGARQGKPRKLGEKKRVKEKRTVEQGPSSSVQREAKSIYTSLDLSGMTRFKKAMIYQAIRRSVTEPKDPTDDPSGYDAINPIKLYPLTYDPTIDKLVMGGIQLQINEHSKSFQCLECGESVIKSKHNRHLYNHVLGFHLNLFQCPHCPAQLKDCLCFKEHVLSHSGKFTCDICGMFLKRSDTLKHHKWTHKSPEEKQEAIQNGERPNWSSSYRTEKMLATASTCFMCSTCGKGPFPDISRLKSHEKSHQEPEHLCPQCGKKFCTMQYLEHHQKFVCPAGSSNPEERMKAKSFKCDLCPKTFFNRTQVKLHKISMHTDDRPFKCSFCDKMFKLEGLRKTHEKTHFDTKTFACGNGCGALFKRRDNAARHEKTCTKFF